MNYDWKNHVVISTLTNLSSKIFNINMFTKTKRSGTINEVLFYGGEDDKGKKQTVGLNNLFCIYFLINHASRSVDICMPSLISDTIAKCLVSTQQRNNVKIRVAIHNSNDFSNLNIFAKYGIEVKVINSHVQLQHEFILIDSENQNEAVAVMGSLDYDIKNVNCNRDATVLTSEPTVIQTLKAEFDRVWSSATIKD